MIKFRPEKGFRKNARELAFGAVTAAALLGASGASFPAAAQQTLEPQKIATTVAPSFKKMSEVDCRVVGKLVEFQVDKYGDKLSDEFVTDFAKYVGGGCVGFSNGKPYEIRVLTKQDDFSGAVIVEIAGTGKVSVRDTGVVVSYPKGTPAPQEAAGRPDNRRSELTTAPILAKR